jgi:CheY-like chemotaxis protein
MRIVFVDDEPENVELVSRTLAEALDAEVHIATTVEQAVELLHAAETDLVIADIFIPLGRTPEGTLGPRARRYAETVRHLGGLVLLDELDRVVPAPKVLAHTACTDFALLEVLGDRVHAKVPKPAPVDVLLRAALEALELPVPG